MSEADRNIGFDIRSKVPVVGPDGSSESVGSGEAEPLQGPGAGTQRGGSRQPRPGPRRPAEPLSG